MAPRCKGIRRFDGELRSAAEEAEAGADELCASEFKRIGVDTTFGRHKKFNCAGVPLKPEAAFSPEALLSASVLCAVHPEYAGCEPTEESGSMSQGSANLYVGLNFPTVVNSFAFDNSSCVETSFE